MRHETKRLVQAWIALLVLLALSAGSARLSLGPWNSVLNLGIAVVKALLVLLVFMRLARAGPLPRLVAATALATLVLLLVLSGADYATRRLFSAPWNAPPADQTQAKWRQASIISYTV